MFSIILGTDSFLLLQSIAVVGLLRCDRMSFFLTPISPQSWRGLVPVAGFQGFSLKPWITERSNKKLYPTQNFPGES